MKIYIDDREVLNLSASQIKSFEYSLPSAIVESHIEDIIVRVISGECHKMCRKLQDDWNEKLAARSIQNIPLAIEGRIDLICSQEDYKDADARNAEAEVI